MFLKGNTKESITLFDNTQEAEDLSKIFRLFWKSSAKAGKILATNPGRTVESGAKLGLCVRQCLETTNQFSFLSQM